METINIHQAKTNLSQLLSRVTLGEEIIISNRSVPIAKLIPFDHFDRRSSLGQDRDKVTISEDFNDPLPEEILCVDSLVLKETQDQLKLTAKAIAKLEK